MTGNGRRRRRGGVEILRVNKKKWGKEGRFKAQATKRGNPLESTPVGGESRDRPPALKEKKRRKKEKSMFSHSNH